MVGNIRAYDFELSVRHTLIAAIEPAFYAALQRVTLLTLKLDNNRLTTLQPFAQR